MGKRMGPAAILGAVALILCGAPAMALSQDGAALRAAEALIRRKKFDEADAKIASILKVSPGHGRALHVRSKLLKAKGDKKGAIEALEGAYRNVGRLPELSKADERLLGKIRADFMSIDKKGQYLRTIDDKHLRKITNFAMDMLRKKVEDLHARTKSLAFSIDPGNRVVRQFLKNEINYYKYLERRKAEAAAGPQNWGLAVGGGRRRSFDPTRGRAPDTGGPGKSTYASNTTFEMDFNNQAMMRWLTQMFTFADNSAPLVENGFLRFDHELHMYHHKALLSEGRQVRVTAEAGAGVVALGVVGKPDALRVEAGKARGPGGETRTVPPAAGGVDELVLQRVDGRYQGFVNGMLVFTSATDLGDDRIAVMLSDKSQAYSLALEAAENIAPTVSPAALDADAAAEAKKQAEDDRKRAAGQLAEGRRLYNARQYADAVGPLNEAAALNPLLLEALYLVAKCREKAKRRRPACQAYFTYLQTARKLADGEIKPPEGVSVAQADPKRLADARKTLMRIDREGRKLEKSLKAYLVDLEKLKPKVQKDAFALKRVEARIKQVRKLVLVP